MTRLTVAIATLAERAHGLTEGMLPPTQDVDYHVFVQGVDDLAQLPLDLQRADITVTPLKTRGVAHSRNAAIGSVKGDILLFADDDLILNTNSYALLQTLLAQNPDLDFICGQIHDANGLPFKSYSPDRTPASRFNTAKVGTPEMAVRVASIRKIGVLFDPDFGAGCANWLGDEYIFLCDALCAGLKGQHTALTFATHPAPSSGQDNSAASFTVREAVLRRALGRGSWPLRCAFALRHRKRFPDWTSLLRFIRP